MDTRAARRAAEKAARDLINKRAALVGELGVAQAERTQLDADVTAAAERGRQLVAAAEVEAGQLVETAQACVRDADQRYADVYSAVTAAGWAVADLTALGFPPRDGATPRRRRPQPSQAPLPVSTTAHANPNVPQQHDRTASPAGAPA